MTSTDHPDTRPGLDALRVIDEAIEGYRIAVKQWQRHADSVSRADDRLKAHVRAETWAAAVVDLSARRDRLAASPERPGLDALLDEHLVPLWRVRGDDLLEEGVMRRCLLCGRTSKIVDVADDADVAHEADCSLVSLRAALASSSHPTEGQPQG